MHFLSKFVRHFLFSVDTLEKSARTRDKYNTTKIANGDSNATAGNAIKPKLMGP